MRGRLLLDVHISGMAFDGYARGCLTLGHIGVIEWQRWRRRRRKRHR